MNEKERVAKIIKPLIDYYKADKNKLIKLCLKEGISKTRIARALDITLSGISHFIKKNNLEE